MKFYNYTAAVVVAAAISFSGLKPAYGELVFDDDLNTAAKPAVVETTTEARAEERNELSKSEVMRRQRLREELKNEDLLTTKLEELRLKDEMKRTEQLLGSGIKKDEAAASPMLEQRVGSAVADIATAPVAGTNPALTNTVGVDINGAPQGVSTTTAPAVVASDDENSRVTVGGRAGLPTITNSMYDISGKFAAGLQVGVDLSEHIAFTGGYTYSSYSLGAGSAVAYPTGFNTTNNLQRLNLNDNLIDAGAKFYFLGTRAKLRPFIGGGFGYRRGYVNYDDATRKYLRSFDPNAAGDVEISGFSGYVEAGLEFKITKAISFSGSFRYFNTLSSSQSNPLNPNGFVNSNNYNGATAYGYGSPYYGGVTQAGYYGAYGYSNDTRGQASDALAKNNFYQLMAGIAVSF